jgi:hypothetical protein
MKNQVFVALLLLSGGAIAQQAPYATIVEVEGLVTVTTNNQLSNAVKDMPLTKGGQVLATGSGTATVAFSNGCKVSLKPGDSLAVDEAACKTFVASSGSSSLLTPTVAGLAGLGLGALVARNTGNANVGTPLTPVVVPAAPAAPAAVAIPATPVAPVSGA